MPTPIPADRLPRLRAALERYAEGQKESQQHLAEIYGVALSRFVTLIKSRFKGFPEHERHNDKTHWYDARRAISAMIAYVEGQLSGRRVAAARAAAALGGQPVAPAGTEATVGGNAEWPEGLLTPADLDRLASAQTKLWRLRQQQGMYVLKSECEDLARTFYSLATQRIMNIPNVVDANGRMPAAERAALQKECREINLALHKEFERRIGLLDDEEDEGDVDGRTGGDQGAAGRARGTAPRRGHRVRPGGVAGTA